MDHSRHHQTDHYLVIIRRILIKFLSDAMMGLSSRVQRLGGATLKEHGVVLQFYVKVRNLEINLVKNLCEG